MEIEEYLKDRLSVPTNWDKYDYQSKRYSFEDMHEMATDLVKNFELTAVVESACFDYQEGISMNCAKCGQAKYLHK